jgi:hypothetical protein
MEIFKHFKKILSIIFESILIGWFSGPYTLAILLFPVLFLGALGAPPEIIAFVYFGGAIIGGMSYLIVCLRKLYRDTQNDAKYLMMIDKLNDKTTIPIYTTKEFLRKKRGLFIKLIKLIDDKQRVKNLSNRELVMLFKSLVVNNEQKTKDSHKRNQIMDFIMLSPSFNLEKYHEVKLIHCRNKKLLKIIADIMLNK